MSLILFHFKKLYYHFFADYDNSQKMFSSSKKTKTNTAKKIVKRLKLFLMNSTEISPKKFNEIYSDDNSDKEKNGNLTNGKNKNNDLTDYFDNDMMEGEERMIAQDIFSIVLRTFGVTLSDLELLILSDSTDINPYGNKIKIDVIYDILKHHNDNNNNHNNNNNYKTNKYNDYSENEGDDERNSSNKNRKTYDNDYSESSLFALRHIARQIWRSADQLKRFEIFSLVYFI